MSKNTNFVSTTGKAHTMCSTDKKSEISDSGISHLSMISRNQERDETYSTDIFQSPQNQESEQAT